MHGPRETETPHEHGASSEHPADEAVAKQNVRRILHTMRQRWDKHSPEAPFMLCDEIEPGCTVARFCMQFVTSQRIRKVPAASRDP